MDAVRIIDRLDGLHWSYDRDGDVLYISLDEPRDAVGVDLGNGLVARYDEDSGDVVGLTVIGLRARMENRLSDSP